MHSSRWCPLLLCYAEIHDVLLTLPCRLCTSIHNPLALTRSTTPCCAEQLHAMQPSMFHDELSSVLSTKRPHLPPPTTITSSSATPLSACHMVPVLHRVHSSLAWHDSTCQVWLPTSNRTHFALACGPGAHNVYITALVLSTATRAFSSSA